MDIARTCDLCGRAFTAHRKTQRFCSKACRRLAYRKHPKEEDGAGPALRTFPCARCGRLVRVTDERDQRRKFCSSHCERLYWKHSKEKAGKEVCRTFQCRQCGKTVTVTDPRSRRRAFCSDACRLAWQKAKQRGNLRDHTEETNCIGK